MQYIKHAIISVAGLGSRLGLNISKCLVEINGKKIIEYQLALLKDIKDVRLVVGFKEKEVMDFVKKIRSDVTFVRNPDYANTSNSYSVYLATKNLKAPFIIIDGDLIIGQKTFKNFLNKCKEGENLIGVTKSKSEDAVFTEIDKNFIIKKFYRKPKTAYEWCGIAYLHNIKINDNKSYIYRELEKYLPLRGINIDCYEIDTPNDLEIAVANIKNLK